MTIEWTDNLSVGNELIDYQHQRLVEMLNEAIDNQGAEIGSEEMVDLLSKMTAYAGEHFLAEEQYMQEISYPHLKQHKTEHKKFKEQVARFCIDVMESKNTVAGDILDFLAQWMTDHLILSDSKYKEYADSQAINS